MHYAHYLHARITAYRTVKHDIVRVQAENNRASAYRTHTEGASGESFALSLSPQLPLPERCLRKYRGADRLVLLGFRQSGRGSCGR
jgi:hypothetical protein